MSFVELQTYTVKNDMFLLDVVQRVMRATGIAPPASLGNPSEHTSMAIGAIDAAARRIWYAAKWDWRNFWVPLEISVGSTYFYELPARYDSTGTNPVCGHLKEPLMAISYAQLVRNIPTFSMVPIGQMITDDLGSIIVAFLADDRNIGVPKFWGIQGSHVFVFPVPDTEALETLDLPDDKIVVNFNFYATYEGLMDAVVDGENVLVGIPQHMSHVLHHLSAGIFQGDLEYPGAGQNESRGERTLAAAVASHRKLKREEDRFLNTNDYAVDVALARRT